ncbi:MAG: PQQ-dependent sugar dehydrogenase [Ginsengibacter sp.]
MKLNTTFSFALFVIFFVSACNTLPKKNQTEKEENTLTDSISVKLQLVSSIPEEPVELNTTDDNSGRSFITDVKGKIWIIKNDSVQPKPFFNLYEKIGKPDSKSIIGIIFGVAFHPQYATNHKFYVCYNAPSKPNSADSKLVVSQFTSEKDNPDLVDLKSEQEVIEFKGATVQDNGAQIVFGPDGYLYISLGDDNAKDTTYRYRSQDLNFLNGKLLRINVDNLPYTIPADNPFVHVKNARPEIWAYGFRKLWHFSFDPHSGQIFGGDVGEEKEEEIDMITKGANYGWPIMEGNSVYEKNNGKNDHAFVAPINTYTHETGICIIGGKFYYGNDIPELRNKYFFADWKEKLFALAKDNHGKWQRQPVKIVNQLDGKFFICGCGEDSKNQLFVMGYLVNKTGEKGVIYKVLKG